MPAFVLNNSAVEVGGRAVAGRSVIHRIGHFLRTIDEFRDRLHLQRFAQHQHMRDHGDARDRRKVRHAVIRAVFQKALIGCVRLVGAEDQRMAVGIGAGDRHGSDRAGAAAAIVDCDRLAEIGRRLIGVKPRHGIDRSAGRVGHDDGDGLGWKALRMAALRREAQAGSKSKQSAQGGPAGQHRVFSQYFLSFVECRHILAVRFRQEKRGARPIIPFHGCISVCGLPGRAGRITNTAQIPLFVAQSCGKPVSLCRIALCDWR